MCMFLNMCGWTDTAPHGAVLPTDDALVVGNLLDGGDMPAEMATSDAPGGGAKAYDMVDSARVYMGDGSNTASRAKS